MQKDLIALMHDPKIAYVSGGHLSTVLKTQDYHYLRHTFGTLMAEMNTPTHLLCAQMGHGNIHITQRYYIALSATGIEVLQRNLKQL